MYNIYLRVTHVSESLQDLGTDGSGHVGIKSRDPQCRVSDDVLHGGDRSLQMEQFARLAYNADLHCGFDRMPQCVGIQETWKGVHQVLTSRPLAEIAGPVSYATSRFSAI